MSQHIDRLRDGLEALKIDLQSDINELGTLSDQLVAKNNLSDAIVYWQITRGVAPRIHQFPDPSPKPTILMIAYPASSFKDNLPTPTIRAITQQDQRWLHCQIKTTQLLPNVLARQAASDAGKDEAILVRDNIVTEATARSIFIVKDGNLRTYPLDGRILDSITRQVVLEMAQNMNITVDQTPFTLDDLQNADEIIAVGTNTEVASIIELDGKTVGDGSAGELTTQLFQQYRNFVKRSCNI